MANIDRLEGTTSVVISGLTIDDAVLADLLDGQPPATWAETVGRALAVGARGLVTMGLGVNLEDMDARVRLALDDVVSRAQACSNDVLEAGRKALASDLDPEVRSSLVGKALAELATARDGLLAGLDPRLADSQAARFISEVTELLGPDGQLEQRLRDALDPDADGSGLARFASSVEARFQELRDLIMKERGRAEEAERGTAKGAAFEDLLEERLRVAGRGLGGCIVERSSRVAGRLGPEAFVGDLVLTLPTGSRVVIEAKNTATLVLNGKSGVLAELDRAMANRDAEFAICVSAQAAYPGEVGFFAVYGNRVLVVDDGSGELLTVALRWAAAAVAASGLGTGADLDAATVLDRLDRLRSLAQRFSTAKRTLTDVRSSIEAVRDQLDGMRADLLDGVDDLCREIQAAVPASRRVA